MIAILIVVGFIIGYGMGRSDGARKVRDQLDKALKGRKGRR